MNHGHPCELQIEYPQLFLGHWMPREIWRHHLTNNLTNKCTPDLILWVGAFVLARIAVSSAFDDIGCTGTLRREEWIKQSLQ